MRILTFILAISIFSACNTFQTEDIPIIRFLSHSDTEFNNNLILKKIISLQDSSFCLISPDSKMILAGNEYYFLDKNSKTVYRFGKEGKFINKIGVPGRGPGEYLGAEDFITDQEKGSVEILSLQEQKISRYTREGGFLEALNIAGTPFSFMKCPDGNYFFAKGPGEDWNNKEISTCQLYKTNARGELLQAYFPIKNTAYNTPLAEESFQASHGKTFFKTWISRNIYEMTPEGPVLRTQIDFQNDTLDLGIFTQTPAKMMEALMNSKFYTIEKYSENDSYIYVYVMDGTAQQQFHIIYSKENGSVRIFENPGRENLSENQMENNPAEKNNPPAEKDPGKNNTSPSGYLITGGARMLTPENELIFLAEPLSGNGNCALITYRILP